MRLFVLILAAVGLAGADKPRPVSLAISQIWDSPPELVVALNPRGPDGLPVRIGKPRITASFAGAAMDVRADMPFDATPHGVAYLVLVDVSKSLDGARFAAFGQAIAQFKEGLRPQDRMAVVSFGDEVRVESDFTGDRAALGAVFGRLKPAARQTKLHLALSRAFELGRRHDAGLPPRRAIVVLSDGKDEGSGLTLDDLLARPESRFVPVFAIGSSRLPPPEQKKCFDALRRLAAHSGGEFLEAGSDFAEAYERARKSILGVYLAGLTCGRCADKARTGELEVRLEAGGKVLVASTRWTLPEETARGPKPVRDSLKDAPPPAPWYSRTAVIGPMAGAAIGSAVLAFVWVRSRQHKQPPGVAGEAPLMDAAPGPAPEPRPAATPPLPPPLTLQLVVVRGQQPGAEHRLQLASESVVGRDADCQLPLRSEPEIGSRQFALMQTGGKILVKDLNGNTSLNGVPLYEPYPVRDGDIIGAGGVELRLLVKRR